ncbi:hypothetical protein Scep_025428 [Stephania cephalantha]|uniref:Uncharacterized protein n=1 Tax=Stephania cephalantha TaxID=152367 RepID=A0AAP0HPC6_9MAGN
MGSEPELPIRTSPEPTALTTPKLLLFSLPHPNLFPPPSDEPPGMVTPPLRAPGSVPFLWEEAPGKPIRTSARTAAPDEPKSLDLPPRLLVSNHDVITNQNHHHHHNVVKVSQMTNMPSPTTVLDGPYRVVGRSASYSAVFSREPRRTRSKASYGGSPPRDQHFFHQNHGKYSGGSSSSSRGFFFKGSSKVDLDEGNSVIYDPCEHDGGDQESTNNNNNKVKIRRSRKSNGSLLMSLSSTSSRNKTHLWAGLFGSLKQAVSWKSRKAKN